MFVKNNLKYKVGQKVEINFELTLEMKRNGIFAWHPLMNRALGRIVTIRDIKTHGDCYYLTFVEDEYFFLVQRMLDI